MSHKIRALETLVDFLNEQNVWRVKELTTLKAEISRATDKTQVTLIRAALPILYAHWEGYIKTSSEAYLDYVSSYVASQRLTTKNLSPVFVALPLWKEIIQSDAPIKFLPFSQKLAPYLAKHDHRIKIPSTNTVNSESNLNSQVLREICCITGIDYKEFETKEKLIDERLLGTRNRIAHGERRDLTTTDYNDLHMQIVELLQLFKNLISNAASGKAFLLS